MMATRQLWSDPSAAPIPAKPATALLLIHNQYGYRNTEAFGSSLSNPNHEENTKTLLSTFRTKADSLPKGERPIIFHVQHRTVWTESPIFPGATDPYDAKDRSSKRGVDFAEFSTPRLWNEEEQKHVYIEEFDEKPLEGLGNIKTVQDEIIMTSHGHSIFVNTPMEQLLNKHAVKTLLIAGMPLEQSVSTAVRTAQNLALCGKWGGRGNLEDAEFGKLWTDGAGIHLEAPADKVDNYNKGVYVDMPRIVLVEDAVRAFAKNGLDPETVHAVHIDSLREFAEVRTTKEVVDAFC